MARILLVDDEKVARAVYGDYLKGAGHEVTPVSNFSDARTALSGERYDAVVTDLILPGGDGMEVLQYTKDKHPGIEVIVITALDKVDPAVRAIKSGAAEYLVKPVAPEALQHALSRALTARQLLRENASLRQYVAMLETGQRVATTLDRERLVTVTAGAFAQLCHAHATLLFDRQTGELRFMGARGLESGVADELADTVLERLAAAKPGAIKLDPIPAPYKAALAVPAQENNELLGWAVLLFEAKLEEGHVESATYLGKHLGLALKNLGRFAEVEDLAYLDDLTHLFNLRYLDLMLDREVKSAAQTHVPFSLLFLDLDYFKSINDTHGHLVGSKLLVEVARVIKGCVRDNDVVVRYGGDEYVLLLRATDSGGALKVAERIRRTMEQHSFLAREGYALSVTTCIGVASFPEHAADKASLLDFADRAMYRGKKSTRNVIYVAAKDLEATPVARHSTKAPNGGADPGGDKKAEAAAPLEAPVPAEAKKK